MIKQEMLGMKKNVFGEWSFHKGECECPEKRDNEIINGIHRMCGGNLNGNK